MPKETNKANFEDVSFKKYSKGKYMQSGKGVKGEQYLHRVVWKAHHGAIPRGYEVHHKDHNTLNNKISNLALVKSGKHQAMHNKLEAEARKTKAKTKAKPAKTKAKAKPVKMTKPRRAAKPFDAGESLVKNLKKIK